MEQSCTLTDGVENISISIFQFPIFQPFFWLERRQLPHETGTVRGAAHLLCSVPGFGMLQQTSTAFPKGKIACRANSLVKCKVRCVKCKVSRGDSRMLVAHDGASWRGSPSNHAGPWAVSVVG